MGHGVIEHHPMMGTGFRQLTLRTLPSPRAATTHHTTVAQSLLRSPITARTQTWNPSTREHYPDHLAWSATMHCQRLNP